MKKQLLLSACGLLFAFLGNSQSWNTQNVNPENDGYNFVCMSAVDSLTVMGIGSRVDLPYPSRYFSRTTDGGNTWTSLPLDPDWAIQNLNALSSDTAWIGVSLFSGQTTGNWGASLYKTTDGGQTWNKNLNVPFDSTSYLDVMHFFNSNDGVAFGDV